MTGRACQLVGCDRPATHGFKLCVPALRGPRIPRISPHLTLHACAACADELTAADFIAPGDPGRDVLRAMVGLWAGGRFAPDYARAWVEPVPLASREWAEVERTAAAARLQ